MTLAEKRIIIKAHVEDMLNGSRLAMLRKIDRVLDSGVIDIDEWDENTNPMILPKCIVTALLQNEATQYDGKGTSFEKQIKKDVKNISYYL